MQRINEVNGLVNTKVDCANRTLIKNNTNLYVVHPAILMPKQRGLSATKFPTAAAKGRHLKKPQCASAMFVFPPSLFPFFIGALVENALLFSEIDLKALCDFTEIFSLIRTVTTFSFSLG